MTSLRGRDREVQAHTRRDVDAHRTVLTKPVEFSSEAHLVEEGRVTAGRGIHARESEEDVLVASHASDDAAFQYVSGVKMPKLVDTRRQRVMDPGEVGSDTVGLDEPRKSEDVPPIVFLDASQDRRRKAHIGREGKTVVHDAVEKRTNLETLRLSSRQERKPTHRHRRKRCIVAPAVKKSPAQRVQLLTLLEREAGRLPGQAREQRDALNAYDGQRRVNCRLPVCSAPHDGKSKAVTSGRLPARHLMAGACRFTSRTKPR